MRHSFLLFLLFFVFASACSSIEIPTGRATAQSVVPNDVPYYRYDDSIRDFELLYPKEYVHIARNAADKLRAVTAAYSSLYGWQMDETLFVGLLSKHNQIPNAYSTQFPLNRQMDYPGGTQLIDDMSSASWLATLLYHETAHNYQLNVKANPISEALHTLFGNGFVFLPWLITPNIVENSFLLEGNAVLNESLHDNGGRLYNGRYKALTLLQAQAGNITPAKMYNLRYQVTFPYGDTPYIIGGFYNHYMAKRYGLRGINSYFYHNSEELFFPFFTQESMRRSVGVGFEESLAAFAKEAQEEAKKMQIQKGELLASSAFFAPLGADAKEIYFLCNETGRRAPKLVVVERKTQKVRYRAGSWMFGKVVKTPEGIFATQGSANSDPEHITQGLFDRSGELIPNSGGKMIQGYTPEGKAVYFDVGQSFDEPHLYVGSHFYGLAHSSVLVDANGDMYYFVQNGIQRTLYKNKTPLYSFLGYYGTVCDVDAKGRVYFIAASKFGSTLFRYGNNKIERLSEADNIVDARLLDAHTLLYATVTQKEYRYLKAGMQPFFQKPYAPHVALSEDVTFTARKESSLQQPDLLKPYDAVAAMHYAGSDFAIGYAQTLFGTLNVNFADALTQNALNVYFTRDEQNISVAGAGYANARYLLSFFLSAYAVVEKGGITDLRDYGVMAEACLPLYKKRYESAFFKASYMQDYTTHSRSPASLTLALAHKERYGVAMFYNDLHVLNLYMQKERRDLLAGAAWRRGIDMPYEFYLSAAAKYTYSDANIAEIFAYRDNRGVKVENTGMLYGVDVQCAPLPTYADVARVTMPTIDGYGYFRSAGYGEMRMDKTLNFSFYRFTFPLSLQREALGLRYRHYALERFGGIKEHANEYMATLRADFILLNSMGPVPVSLAYYHNDNAFLTQNADQIKFALGFSF